MRGELNGKTNDQLKNIHFENSDLLWDYLINMQRRENRFKELIYRGHADAEWLLIPTIYRFKYTSGLNFPKYTTQIAEQQLKDEFYLLKHFIYGCDEVGVSVPNDSIEFRNRNLSDIKIQEYCRQPSTWPSDELIEPMVMARLHGLPTRLLDWSRNPFVAVYFAVTDALRMQNRWLSGQKIAIFVLSIDKELRDSNNQFRILHVRGSISTNVVAQQGLFTLNPIIEDRKEPMVIKSFEDFLNDQSSLVKLTIPIEESLNLFYLCNKFNCNAARLFPNADGACMYSIDQYLSMEAYRVS